jgi:hypothetical protein
MTRATIWRDTHTLQACPAGSTALICRRVRLLTAAALRERSEPRSSLSTIGVQHQMMTFVNVTIDQWNILHADAEYPLGYYFREGIESKGSGHGRR